MKLKRYTMYEPDHFVDEYISPTMVESKTGEYVKYESYQNAVKIFLQGKLDACFCDDVGQYPLCEQCRVIRKLLGEV